jgi:hypothetical protein
VENKKGFEYVILYLKQHYTMAVKLDYKQKRLPKSGNYTNKTPETIIRHYKIEPAEKS